MDKLTQHERDTLNLITQRNKNPVCLHILGQDLVNHLSEIIRKVEHNRSKALLTVSADQEEQLEAML